jgi:hypothetical protein
MTAESGRLPQRLAARPSVALRSLDMLSGVGRLKYQEFPQATVLVERQSGKALS